MPQEGDMQYNDIFERSYDGTDSGDGFLLTLDQPTQAAWRVLCDLCDRKGFDWWFDELDDDLQDEIFDEIRTNIRG